MILHGNQRGGAKAMGLHLLNTQDNEHVCVHEVKGFMAADLMGALRESEALAKGTKCRQYLYSLSFNPPQGVDASIADFENAFDRAEKVLGLTGQPRVVVFHEKHGRRHAHVVWSRVDSAQMKAIHLPHTKRKLMALARELFIEHEWDLPKGFQHLGGASVETFTMAQWQQAQRYGLHPTEIKDALRQCWERSDGLKSFAAALTERGYRLAKGDRRGFVAVDLYGEVYSIPRWLGIRTKEVTTKLGSPDPLPSVDAATAELKGKVSQRLLDLLAQAQARQTAELAAPIAGKRALTRDHRAQREALTAHHAERWQRESLARLERFNRGWRGIWDRITGRHSAIRKDNELETKLCRARDVEEREALIARQLAERRSLQQDIDRLRARHVAERRRMSAAVADYLNTSPKPQSQPRQHLSLGV